MWFVECEIISFVWTYYNYFIFANNGKQRHSFGVENKVLEGSSKVTYIGLAK